MNDRHADIRALLATLADPSRFQILCELAAGPRHVSDLARTVGLSQSCTTRHVQALARVGSVECRREGKRVMVSIQAADEVTRSLLGWIAATETSPSPALSARGKPAQSGRPVPRGRVERLPSAAAPGPKELPPSDPAGSGTPSGHSSHAYPSPVNQRGSLEDFLL